jgi:hypothetical protein
MGRFCKKTPETMFMTSITSIGSLFMRVAGVFQTPCKVHEPPCKVHDSEQSMDFMDIEKSKSMPANRCRV